MLLALKPDARLTAMWLWTLNAPITNGNSEDGEEEDDPKRMKSRAKKRNRPASSWNTTPHARLRRGSVRIWRILTHLVEVTGDQARLLPCRRAHTPSLR